MRNISIKFAEKIKTRSLHSANLFPKNVTFTR